MTLDDCPRFWRDELLLQHVQNKQPVTVVAAEDAPEELGDTVIAVSPSLIAYRPQEATDDGEL